MYRQHFGLDSAPFRITPDTQRFYAGAHRGAVLDALQYAIQQGEGIVKLSSEIGSGKTMLCRMLADRLAGTVDVVYLVNPSLQREDVLRAIALELGLSPAGGHLEVMHTLHEYLLQRHATGRRVVVFVEEAQGMDLQSLEEIRLLSNLETREDKLLQLLLFGQPELDAHLATKEVRQLRDRITQSFTLPPLRLADLRDYVKFRLRAAGCQGGDPFTPGAYRLLAWASKGLIRRIHILADKALLAAYADSSCQVTYRHLCRALADSEFAPRWFSLRPAWTLMLSAVLLTVGAVGQAVVPDHIGRRPYSDATMPLQVSHSRAMTALASTVAGATQVPNTPVINDLATTRHWLDTDTHALYTIQVMTSDSDSRDSAEKFLRNPVLAAHLWQLHIVPARIGGKNRWIVLFGSYESYSTAQQALRDIPTVLRDHQPYLRSLKAVKAEAADAWPIQEQDT